MKHAIGSPDLFGSIPFSVCFVNLQLICLLFLSLINSGVFAHVVNPLQVTADTYHPNVKSLSLVSHTSSLADSCKGREQKSDSPPVIAQVADGPIDLIIQGIDSQIYFSRSEPTNSWAPWCRSAVAFLTCKHILIVIYWDASSARNSDRTIVFTNNANQFVAC